MHAGCSSRERRRFAGMGRCSHLTVACLGFACMGIDSVYVSCFMRMLYHATKVHDAYHVVIHAYIPAHQPFLSAPLSTRSVNQPINQFCQQAYQPVPSTSLSTRSVNPTGSAINKFCQPAHQPFLTHRILRLCVLPTLCLYNMMW